MNRIVVVDVCGLKYNGILLMAKECSMLMFKLFLFFGLYIPDGILTNHLESLKLFVFK